MWSKRSSIKLQTSGLYVIIDIHHANVSGEIRVIFSTSLCPLKFLWSSTSLWKTNTLWHSWQVHTAFRSSGCMYMYLSSQDRIALLIYGLINYLDSFCSNIFHLLRWKKKLLLSLSHMPMLYFLFLINFIWCRHSYYYWQKELRYWIIKTKQEKLLTQLTEPLTKT